MQVVRIIQVGSDYYNLGTYSAVNNASTTKLLLSHVYKQLLEAFDASHSINDNLQYYSANQYSANLASSSTYFNNAGCFAIGCNLEIYNGLSNVISQGKNTFAAQTQISLNSFTNVAPDTSELYMNIFASYDCYWILPVDSQSGAVIGGLKILT